MRSLSQYHIEAHHILRYAKMWCALCTHVPYLPRTQAKGGYLELSLAWHHSPVIPISLVPSRGRKYHRNSPSSLWEVVRKYHYSWCVSSHNHASGCFNGYISSLRLFNLVIMALPIMLLCFSATQDSYSKYRIFSYQGSKLHDVKAVSLIRTKNRQK